MNVKPNKTRQDVRYSMTGEMQVADGIPPIYLTPVGKTPVPDALEGGQ
jgi:hypothetical protein